MAHTHPQNRFGNSQSNASQLREFPPLGTDIKVLLIWPRFPASFWSFAKIMEILPKKAIHPPLGLLTVAALCPKSWELRLIDRAVEDLEESDLEWADLVMVSGMHVQRDDIHALLRRARALGKRTMVGGPYASSEPEVLGHLADHVVVGEPDEVFDEIAADLERGTARAMYVISEKPDVSKTPVPRFDLLKINKYASMAVQFSRGCPFQCEFCDIITIYGRKPRTKAPAQLLAELDRLYELGWRDQVFIVDDNFIGNHKRALQLTHSLGEWQNRHQRPFFFYTEASMDLAQRPELIEAMVKANFFYVFVGIESPSKDSLSEVKKFQNLRRDPLECIRTIQNGGLWVTGGFIVGFDSDSETIFDDQRQFIEQAAIPWAMAGFLQAPPTTPLYERMRKEGRLLDSGATSNFSPPNFRTRLPLPFLLQGYRETLSALYSPSGYFNRCLNSLSHWTTRPEQAAKAQYPFKRMAATALRSILKQGVLASYRGEYWRFLFQVLRRCRRSPAKLRMGITLLFSAHHFINYAQSVTDELEAELRRVSEPSGAVRASVMVSAWQGAELAGAAPACSVATD
ncbi:MAG TPA: B12-binding domain-containing radical SAM protein [Terriglobia bacterium]|nr:B12-binding domain-containing radical SAM protein [Terriglobia bacterium]